MKILIAGLLLLTSLSIFANSFEVETMVKANAVLGLMKCDPKVPAHGIEICEDEIQNALDVGIHPKFIVDVISKRGLNLPDKKNKELTNWYWVKVAVLLEEI